MHTSAPQSCASTPGCHGVLPSSSPSPTATATPIAATKMTLKVNPAKVKVRKAVKISGTAKPIPTLKGAKVTLKIERKAGAKWVKSKTAAKTVSAKGAFALSYKPTKKGSYRVTASIAKTKTYTAKSMTKAFKAN